MARPRHPSFDKKKTVAENRRARFDYHIDETVEAGIMLTGSEVKSLRLGRCTLGEAFAQSEDGELFLVNCHIPAYAGASHFQHEEKRKRKLLLHKKELERLNGAVARKLKRLIGAVAREACWKSFAAV